MNKACQLYIGTYSRIYSIYHIIKNIHIKYRCWEYWKSPILRSISLEVVFLIKFTSRWQKESSTRHGRTTTFLLLDISWYNFQSDDQVQPNPSKICSWIQHETCYTSEPSFKREEQGFCKEENRYAVSIGGSIVQLYKNNQRSQVSSRCQFMSVWEFHTARHTSQFCRNRK